MLKTDSKDKALLTISEAANLTPYSAEYLSLLVRRGKLPAERVGRNWYITEDALRWYLRRQGKIVRVVRAKEKPELLTLAEAALNTRYSAEYLNLLVRRGHLPAKKIGRNWYTTEAAIRWYLKRQEMGSRTTTLLEDPDRITALTSRGPGFVSEGQALASHGGHSALRLTLLFVSFLVLFILLFPEIFFNSSLLQRPFNPPSSNQPYDQPVRPSENIGAPPHPESRQAVFFLTQP